MAELLLLVSLVVFALGIGLLWWSQRKRQQTRIPTGKAVYLDSREVPGETLVSHRHQLKGRPDFLIGQGSEIIPIEAKTGRTPREPYLSHIMQLMGYCVLVEENYSKRPSHGIIRYSEQQFRVEFTPERERQLLGILAEIKQKRGLGVGEAHRSHNNPRICAACGYGDVCDEQLDQQMKLWE